MNYFSYSDNNEGCGNDGEGFVESLTSLLPSEYFPYKLFDSCNGLILLGSSLREHRYYVCNPLTKQCVAIPKARERVLESAPALAFDPRDSITDQGTIVCYNIEAPTEVEIVEVPDENYPYGRGVIELCKGVLNYANRNESKLLIWLFDDRHHNNSHSGSKAAGGTSLWTLKHSICMDDWRNIIHSAAEREFGYTRIYIIHPNSDIIFLGNRYMIYSYHLKSNNCCFWPYSQCCVNVLNDSDHPKRKKKVAVWRQITACLFK
ncbi:F-box domain-containing protein [Citrus sinensis]|uniref:F-box domain-containing protein n=1 Tax=Citrus sinensis TaxID=2711 RepID=A0ACB8I8S2_CITSI|nr:F-box domain-containing protein [Citrus sinensis]